MEKSHDDIRTDTDCCICFKCFEKEDLKVLECSHKLCKQCLQSLIMSNDTAVHLIKCPYCRHVENILDRVRGKSKDTWVNYFPRYSETVLTTKCEKHCKLFLTYCRDCDTPICDTCITTDHQGHRFVSFEVKADQKREEYEDLCQEYRERLDYRKARMSTNGTVQIQMHYDSALKCIIAEFQKALEELQTMAKKVRSQHNFNTTSANEEANQPRLKPSNGLVVRAVDVQRLILCLVAITPELPFNGDSCESSPSDGIKAESSVLYNVDAWNSFKAEYEKASETVKTKEKQVKSNLQTAADEATAELNDLEIEQFEGIIRELTNICSNPCNVAIVSKDMQDRVTSLCQDNPPPKPPKSFKVQAVDLQQLKLCLASITPEIPLDIGESSPGCARTIPFVRIATDKSKRNLKRKGENINFERDSKQIFPPPTPSPFASSASEDSEIESADLISSYRLCKESTDSTSSVSGSEDESIDSTGSAKLWNEVTKSTSSSRSGNESTDPTSSVGDSEDESTESTSSVSDTANECTDWTCSVSDSEE